MANSRKTSAGGVSIRWLLACSRCTQETCFIETSKVTIFSAGPTATSRWLTWASVSSSQSRLNTDRLRKALRLGCLLKSQKVWPIPKKLTFGRTAALLLSLQQANHLTEQTLRTSTSFSIKSSIKRCQGFQPSGRMLSLTLLRSVSSRIQPRDGASSNSSLTSSFRMLRTVVRLGAKNLYSGKNRERQMTTSLDLSYMY